MGLINISSINGIAEALGEIETGLGAIDTILAGSFFRTHLIYLLNQSFP